MLPSLYMMGHMGGFPVHPAFTPSSTSTANNFLSRTQSPLASLTNCNGSVPALHPLHQSQKHNIMLSLSHINNNPPVKANSSNSVKSKLPSQRKKRKENLEFNKQKQRIKADENEAGLSLHELRERRREAATVRERVRMREMNGMFEKLRTILPEVDAGRRLSKYETLVMAQQYISCLDNILHQNPPAAATMTTTSPPVKKEHHD